MYNQDMLFLIGNIRKPRILRCASLECAHLYIGQTHRSAATFSRRGRFVYRVCGGCQQLLWRITEMMTMKQSVLWRVFITALIFCSMIVSAHGQEADSEKIKALFEGAIDAMGGDAFMNVSDSISEGQLFMFNDRDQSSGLIRFMDYTKFPDKSRFELGNKKNELEITIFDLDKNEGWIIEGRREPRAAAEDEIKGFQAAANHSIDNIFRFRWKDPENKLFYIGAGDGADVTREVVKLIDRKNDEVAIYFDRASKLPVKIEFQQMTTRGVRQRVANEYSQWHKFQEVLTPLRIDGYKNGRRSSQQFIKKIVYNNNIKNDFFSGPVPKTKKK